MYPFRKPRHWTKPLLPVPNHGDARDPSESDTLVLAMKHGTTVEQSREQGLPKLDRIEDERLYTGKEVDRLLNGLISHRSLERYRSRAGGGGPPYIKLGGPDRPRGRVAYLGRDIKAWLLQGRRGG